MSVLIELIYETWMAPLHQIFIELLVMVLVTRYKDFLVSDNFWIIKQALGQVVLLSLKNEHNRRVNNKF